MQVVKFLQELNIYSLFTATAFHLFSWSKLFLNQVKGIVGHQRSITWQMSGKRILCEICGENMNLTDRQPVALPGCGHTFCRLCLIRVNNVNEEIRCPTCRHLHVGPQPEDLPANYALMSLLESKKETCRKHITSAEAAPSAHLSSESRDCHKEKPLSTSNNSTGTRNRDKTLKALKWVGVGAAAAAGGVALVAAAPVALTAVGFTAAGIAQGSIAASMMSAAAIANGGGVAAESLVAVLQSAGAAGIGSTATAALGATGASVGGGLALGISKLFKRARGRSGNNESGSTHNNDDDDDGNNGGERRENRSPKEYGNEENRANHDKNKRDKSEYDSSDESNGGTDETEGDEWECDASKRLL